MGELLDLILDFERKILTLIKDLFLHPKRIADSIVAKDKAYLGAFQFYTFAMSIWIVFYQLGNGFFDFFPERYVLPHRLGAFLDSQQNVFFLIAPFIGLVEFFIPFAIVNWVLFRKRELSWLNHIAMNLYIGGIFLLYGLFAITITYLLEDTTGNLYEIMGIILVFVIPVAYYGYVYVKIFGKPGFISFIKPALVVSVLGLAGLNLFLENPFHELLHRKILFSNYDRYAELVPDSPSVAEYQYNDTLSWFVVKQEHGPMHFNNAFVVTGFVDSLQSFSYQLINPDNYDKTPIRFVKNIYGQSFILNQLDSPHVNFVIQNRINRVFQDTTWLSKIDEQGKLIHQKAFNDHLSITTRLVRNHDRILFSGNSRSERKPIIGELNAEGDSTLNTSVVGEKEHFIDYIDVSSRSVDSSLEFVLSNNESSGLKSVTWIKGTYSNGLFKQEKELSIYKNLFNPVPNFSNGFLHKGKVAIINDSASIVSFQVMTDSSFAINITRINSRKGISEWNEIITLPYDLIYNDEMQTDDQNIYLLGRAVSIFSNGWSLNYKQVPYVMIIDAATGVQKSFHLLPIDNEDTRVHLFSELEYIYTVGSSSYQTGQNVYWCLQGVHSWVINKNKLVNPIN